MFGIFRCCRKGEPEDYTPPVDVQTLYKDLCEEITSQGKAWQDLCRLPGMDEDSLNKLKNMFGGKADPSLLHLASNGGTEGMVLAFPKQLTTPLDVALAQHFISQCQPPGEDESGSNTHGVVSETLPRVLQKAYEDEQRGCFSRLFCCFSQPGGGTVSEALVRSEKSTDKPYFTVEMDGDSWRTCRRYDYRLYDYEDPETLLGPVYSFVVRFEFSKAGGDEFKVLWDVSSKAGWGSTPTVHHSEKCSGLLSDHLGARGGEGEEKEAEACVENERVMPLLTRVRRGSSLSFLSGSLQSSERESLTHRPGKS